MKGSLWWYKWGGVVLICISFLILVSSIAIALKF